MLIFASHAILAGFLSVASRFSAVRVGKVLSFAMLAVMASGVWLRLRCNTATEFVRLF